MIRCIRQWFLLVLFFYYGLAVFSTQSSASENPKGVNIDYPYAINLQSTIKQLDDISIPNLTLFNKYRVYTTKVTIDGKSWTRLRLGFFETKQKAVAAHKKVIKYYPRAWVTIIDNDERFNSIKTVIAVNGQVLPNIKSEQVTTHEDKLTDDSIIASTQKQEQISLKAPTPSISSLAISPIIVQKPSLSEEPTNFATTVTNTTPEIELVSNETTNTPTSLSTKTDKPTRSAQLLEQARNAFTAGEYQKTIQMTTAILESPKSEETQDALELLGLARERNGQIAHAKAEYEKYLVIYPEGEDAERVSQRLAGLVTAVSKPTNTSLTKKTTKPKKPSEWRTLGSFSQYYYRDERSIDDEDNLVDLSSLVTTFDMTSRYRGEKYDQRFQITGDHAYDFIDDNSEGRFSRLFYEVIDKDNNNNFKIGRQTYSEGGVLGRFDGAVLGLGITKKSKVNAAAGYLLDIDQLLDFNYTKNRKFASLSVDLGNEFKNWDISFYLMQQMVDEIIDRQAVGGEVRYFTPTFNIFSIIDYDTSYNELNIFLLNSNWVFPQQGTFYTTIDIRKVPYLSTSNALQGQPFLTMEELLSLFTEEEVRQLALDRTATTHTFTVGGSKQLNGFLKGYGQYQLSGDFTYNNTTGMPASGGVPEIIGTGNNYFLGGQFIGNSIIKRGDTSILSLRLGLTNSARDIAVSFDTRYPITEKFRFNPRVQYLRREGMDNDNLLSTFRLSAKADYRFMRSLLVEGEIGLDHTDDEVGAIVTKSKSIFWYVGYRLDF